MTAAADDPTPPTADDLRRRLVEIESEIRGLAADDFARRHELLLESDRHRAALQDVVAPEAEAATKEWADRAGRKGSHEVDPEVLKASAQSIVPDMSR